MEPELRYGPYLLLYELYDSLNSLEGGYAGDYIGEYYGVYKGNIRSLDYSLYVVVSVNSGTPIQTSK